MSASFADWVSTADAVRATAKKLEKHAVLARYLGSLEDGDLVVAARLLAGAPFPRRDERVLSVGWSALSDVLLERSGKTGEDMAASYQRHADLGDVAAELIGEDPPRGDRVSLADVVATFDASGSNGGNAIARSSAMNCSPGQFEVDTIVYRDLGGAILSEFRAEPFAFAIP